MKRTPALFNGKDLVADLECIYDNEECITRDGWQLGYINGSVVESTVYSDSNRAIFILPARLCDEAKRDLLYGIRTNFLEIYEEKDLEIDVDERHQTLSFYFTEPDGWDKRVAEMNDDEFTLLSKAVLKRMVEE